MGQFLQVSCWCWFLVSRLNRQVWGFDVDSAGFQVGSWVLDRLTALTRPLLHLFSPSLISLCLLFVYFYNVFLSEWFCSFACLILFHFTQLLLAFFPFFALFYILNATQSPYGPSSTLFLPLLSLSLSSLLLSSPFPSCPPVPLSVRMIRIPLWVRLSKAWLREGRGFFRWTPSRLSPPQQAPLGTELSLPCPHTCTSARMVIYVAIPASPAQPSLQQLGPQPAGSRREGGLASRVAFEH